MKWEIRAKIKLQQGDLGRIMDALAEEAAKTIRCVFSTESDVGEIQLTAMEPIPMIVKAIGACAQVTDMNFDFGQKKLQDQQNAPNDEEVGTEGEKETGEKFHREIDDFEDNKVIETLTSIARQNETPEGFVTSIINQLHTTKYAENVKEMIAKSSETNCNVSWPTTYTIEMKRGIGQIIRRNFGKIKPLLFFAHIAWIIKNFEKRSDLLLSNVATDKNLNEIAAKASSFDDFIAKVMEKLNLGEESKKEFIKIVEAMKGMGKFSWTVLGIENRSKDSISHQIRAYFPDGPKPRKFFDEINRIRNEKWGEPVIEETAEEDATEEPVATEDPENETETVCLKSFPEFPIKLIKGATQEENVKAVLIGLCGQPADWPEGFESAVLDAVNDPAKDNTVQNMVSCFQFVFNKTGLRIPFPDLIREIRDVIPM